MKLLTNLLNSTPILFMLWTEVGKEIKKCTYAPGNTKNMLIVFLSVGVIGSLIAIIAIKVGITLEARRNEKVNALRVAEVKQDIKLVDGNLKLPAVTAVPVKEKDITIK